MDSQDLGLLPSLSMRIFNLIFVVVTAIVLIMQYGGVNSENVRTVVILYFVVTGLILAVSGWNAAYSKGGFLLYPHVSPFLCSFVPECPACNQNTPH